jgi:hypothetical protein
MKDIYLSCVFYVQITLVACNMSFLFILLSEKKEVITVVFPCAHKFPELKYLGLMVDINFYPQQFRKWDK